ncbi:hypothetical protein KSP39_PZI020836 [Platanthera zijinensis]|uniref:Wound-induced protein 1 n=1 Tax=Platanthera zijinensis TaxID=2320716 RepID=A0AAP0B0C9_9ASPA
MEDTKKIVLRLYKGIARGETGKVAALLAPDLDWWFHGPPGRDHMMRILTGADEDHRSIFRFNPRRVEEAGRWVVAEGWELAADAYWVHVWVIDGGIITQFRECFNTSVTVRELSPKLPPKTAAAGWPTGGQRSVGPGLTVWESQERLGRSLPGLVLTI